MTPERAMLVGVFGRGEREAARASLDELAQLALTAGARVVGELTQQLDTPSRYAYIGKGKLDELISLKDRLSYDVVIFDDELSPLQQRHLEEALQVKIIDRVALILDIFARRARTREGKLQVELAQLEYLLPRLAGQWRHLERLGGGIGTRGPGESQLETDRRLIRLKIQRLEKDIEQVRKQRGLYRKQRQKSGIPVIALVGYTNAGKSTLLNTLTRAGVLVEDKPFATLDPTTRRTVLPDARVVLITDTVGFIRRLPPNIVKAFRATLEELNEADVLLHVVDFSSPDAVGQCQTVEDILKEMGLQNKPRVTALNKIDAVLSPDRQWEEAEALDYLRQECPREQADTVLISAARGWGFSDLLLSLQRTLETTRADVDSAGAL